METKLTLTHVRVIETSLRVLEGEWFAHLTVCSHRVVLTIVAHTTGHVARGDEDGVVKVTAAGVVVAVANCRHQTSK